MKGVKNMVWNILIGAAMWILGLLVFSYGALQILICLFCAFPMTAQINRKYPGRIDASGIYRKYVVSVVVLGVLTAAITWAVFHWGNDWAKYGYLIGVGIAFVLSLGKWGMTVNNAADYLQKNEKYIAKIVYDELMRALLVDLTR